MKKKAILTIVAGSVTALVLTAVLAVALSTDGFGVGSARADFESGSTHLTAAAGDTYQYTWDPAEDDTTGLSIHWADGMVDVKVGAGNLIKITEQADTTDLTEPERLQLKASGGVLKIDWGEKKLGFFDFSFFDKHRKDLTVELPRELAAELSVLSVSNTSGDVTIDGCTAKEFSVNSTSGDLLLTALKGKALAANTVSGKISLSNAVIEEDLSAHSVSGGMQLSGVSAQTAHVETVSGDARYEGRAQEFYGDSVSAGLNARLQNCPKVLDMNAVSGKLTLGIPENNGFYADYSSISGSFSSDFPVTGGLAKSGKALYGDGRCDFSFSTTSGDIRIEELKN